MSAQASRHTLKIRLACYNAAGRHQHRDRPWRDVRAVYSPPPQPKREESLHRGCRPRAVADVAQPAGVGALENGEMSDGNLRNRLRRPGSLIAPGR